MYSNSAGQRPTVSLGYADPASRKPSWNADALSTNAASAARSSLGGASQASVHMSDFRISTPAGVRYCTGVPDLKPVSIQSSQGTPERSNTPQNDWLVGTPPVEFPVVVVSSFCVAILLLCAFVELRLFIIVCICGIAQLFAVRMGRQILSLSEGTESMATVGFAIREGSEAYIVIMFGTIFKLTLPCAIGIFLCYLFQGTQNAFRMSVMTSFSFVAGSLCSSASGVAGMLISTRANTRVAQNACEAHSTLRDTLVIALRSGAIVGVSIVSLAVIGISVLFAIGCLIESDHSRVPLTLVGYGFGASFVALFAQLGGGIFTKAADVGADLCGKIEHGIPEDDPRNPAVIADLVGDNVGDCCARGADLFESLAAEVIAAMILGGTLTRGCAALQGVGDNFVLFPLAVHAADLVVSTIGVLIVRGGHGYINEAPGSDPMVLLTRGYIVAMVLASICFFVLSYNFLNTQLVPRAWLYFAICGMVGVLTGFVLVLITQFYTSSWYRPVRDIAKASEGGHGTNVIAGLAVGLESTFLPILVISGAIITSYYLGMSSGLDLMGTNPTTRTDAGLFGTAVATMGMLSNLTYVLAMDIFGPIVDNAAGIVEMSQDCPEGARVTMDRLDAAGNTTKAFTKGFAVGSAGLACFLLFRAFEDVVEGMGYEAVVVDIVQPEVFVAGIIGGATVCLFSALSMHSVGTTALKVVEEVRRQFREVPGLAEGNGKPMYGVCVEIVSAAAIRCMVKPGLLVLLTPLLLGLVFRLLGSMAGDPMLGARALTSYLACSSMTAILMALFLNNGGGAWDNAKKLIEAGSYGGKSSEAHKAAVTGDTVGDPCKDTAGPSLHVLMKLTATVTMVAGPIVALPLKM